MKNILSNGFLPKEMAVREFLEEVNRKLPKFKRIKTLYVKSESNGGRIK